MIEQIISEFNSEYPDREVLRISRVGKVTEGMYYVEAPVKGSDNPFEPNGFVFMPKGGVAVQVVPTDDIDRYQKMMDTMETIWEK